MAVESALRLYVLQYLARAAVFSVNRPGMDSRSWWVVVTESERRVSAKWIPPSGSRFFFRFLVSSSPEPKTSLR